MVWKVRILNMGPESGVDAPKEISHPPTTLQSLLRSNITGRISNSRYQPIQAVPLHSAREALTAWVSTAARLEHRYTWAKLMCNMKRMLFRQKHWVFTSPTRMREK